MILNFPFVSEIVIFSSPPRETKIKKDDKSEATIEDIEYMITHVENDQEISEKEKTELINELDNIKKEMDINSHNKLEINENT